MSIVRASDDSCNNAAVWCRIMDLRNLVRNPVGIQPHPAKVGRRRVMRGPGVTQGAKRSQGVAPKCIGRGRRRCVGRKARRLSVEAGTLPGSERVACGRVGFPGTREASSSPSPAHQEAVDAWRPTERTRRCSDGTAAKATKRGGMGGEDRSQPPQSCPRNPARPSKTANTPLDGIADLLVRDGACEASVGRMRQNPHVRICGGCALTMKWQPTAKPSQQPRTESR